MENRRVLILTGKMAYFDLMKLMADQPTISVEALPISVAAFTTPKLVKRHLSKHKPSNDVDFILVSGLAQGDYSNLEGEFGIPVLKGTRNISALPLLFSNIEEVYNELSGSAPADKTLQMYIIQEIRRQFNQAEQDAVYEIRNFKLSTGLAIGIDVAPKVMAEVVDVTTRPYEVCIETARKYAKDADIIDLGASISTSDPERLAEMTCDVKKLGVTISVDSLNPEEILAAVDAGAEIVLSLDYGNIDVLTKLPEDVAVVCLPTNVSAGLYPKDPNERARKCVELCNLLRKNGYSKVLADPVLESAIQPGLMKSLVAFYDYRHLDQETPFLAGIANITEFIDSDTLGINAVLSLLGVELGVAVFLSTEERPSTQGCIRELRSTVQLAFLAKLNNSPPKELGITAFASKSSEFSAQPFAFDDTFQTVEESHSDHEQDPLGCFRIGVDRNAGLILCEHKNRYGHVKRFASTKSAALLKEIVNGGLVGNLEHAAYLGAELAKAEISLCLGHDYQQDEKWSMEFNRTFLNIL